MENEMGMAGSFVKVAGIIGLILAALAGLLFGVPGFGMVGVAALVMVLIGACVLERFDKARAATAKHAAALKKHPYVASLEELLKVLEITGLRRVDPSVVHLCNWQGRAVTDRDMPNGKREFDVIFKKSPEGWKAQCHYLGATPETLPKTWPEGCHPTPLAAVQAEMSSVWTNSKAMHEFLQCFSSITAGTSAEHESLQAERKEISRPRPNHENPAPLEDKKPESKAAEPNQSEK